MHNKFTAVSEGLPELVDEKFIIGLGVVKQSKYCVIKTKNNSMQIGFYREVIENGVPVRGWWLFYEPTSDIDNDGIRIFNVVRWLSI